MARTLTPTLAPNPLALTLTPTPTPIQAAAQEAARLDLSADEVGQFFHARMLQSLGRYTKYYEVLTP